MSLLGIDIGTTGCKAEAFSIKGKPLAYAYREYKSAGPSMGRFEQDADLVWDYVCSMIKEINAKLENDPVQALSASVSGDEIVPVDRNGVCLHPVIMSADKRGEDSHRKIIAHFGIEKIYQITGIVSTRKYGINRALWYKSNKPELYNQTWRFLTWEDFIYLRLGLSNPTCSFSSLARLMILDIRKKTVWKEMLDFAGIKTAQFSAGVDSGESIGSVSMKASKELGFLEPPMIVAGGFDQSCAAFGAGVIDDKRAMVGTGTMEALCVSADQPIESESLMLGYYASSLHVVRDMYNCTATNVCGGAMLKWLRDTFFEEEKRRANEAGTDIYEQILSGLSTAPSGLIVLPHFAGSGPPYKDADATGVILGLTLNTTKKDIVLAVLEGITFELRQNIENIERGTGRIIASLLAVGGGAKSDFWLQLKADISGKEVIRIGVNEAGCTAGAMLCWMALNQTNDYGEAVKQFVHEESVFEPDMRRHQNYDEVYAAYKKVYPSTRALTHRLGAK